MKLKEKTRIGSRVKKRYDTPKTPFQRVHESKHIDSAIKRRLKGQYEKLNPAELKRNIQNFKTNLWNWQHQKPIQKKMILFIISHEATDKHFV